MQSTYNTASRARRELQPSLARQPYLVCDDDNANPWALLGGSCHQISISFHLKSLAAPPPANIGCSLDAGQLNSGDSAVLSGFDDPVLQLRRPSAFRAWLWNRKLWPHHHGHTGQGAVVGVHGLWFADRDRPNGCYAILRAYIGVS